MKSFHVIYDCSPLLRLLKLVKTVGERLRFWWFAWNSKAWHKVMKMKAAVFWVPRGPRTMLTHVQYDVPQQPLAKMPPFFGSSRPLATNQICEGECSGAQLVHHIVSSESGLIIILTSQDLPNIQLWFVDVECYKDAHIAFPQAKKGRAYFAEPALLWQTRSSARS